MKHAREQRKSSNSDAVSEVDMSASCRVVGCGTSLPIPTVGRKRDTGWWWPGVNGHGMESVVCLLCGFATPPSWEPREPRAVVVTGHPGASSI